MIIFFGPCDITAISTYIRKNNNVLFIDKNTTGTFDLCESTYWVQDILNQKVSHPFISKYAYPEIDFRETDINGIVISLLCELGRGLYENKKGQYLKFGFANIDATKDYLLNYKAEVDWYGKEVFEAFSEEWCFKGTMHIKDIISNYQIILNNIPDRVHIYILLTPTFKSKYGETNDYFKTINGTEVFAKLNNMMKAHFAYKSNITFLDPTDYYIPPKKKSDLFYYNSPSIRHYPRSCYRSIALYLSKKEKEIKFDYTRDIKRFIKKHLHLKR